jgi:glycosyltransferase involved in cell wall biosynthesis
MPSEHVHSQRVLVIACRSITGSDPTYDQVSAGLEYARVPYAVFDPSVAGPFADLRRFSSIIIATHRLQGIDDRFVRNLSDFVSRGGGLVVAVPVWHYRLAPLLGVERWLGRRPPADPVATTTTLQFLADFYPGLGDLKAPLPFVENNFSLTLVPGDAVEVLALDAAGEPVAWVHRVGRGKVLVWNTQLLTTRFGVGLLVQSVLHSHRVALAPIANAGVVQIDDFPAGFTNLAAEPVLTEHGLKFADFLREIWLPDVLQLGDEFDIAYTFFLLFTYAGSVAPPYSFAEWEQCSHDSGDAVIPLPVALSREIPRRHELGFHGYNHVPPTRAAWKNELHLAAAIRAAMVRWEQDGLGEPPRCFAPPMNEIDDCGLIALAAAAPSIATISGHFLGSFREGQARDFGPEPWSPGLFSLPRLTDGYEMHPMNQFFMLSTLAAFGVWTHFFHPDDVIDTPENFPGRTSYRNAGGRRWRTAVDGTEPCHSQLRRWFRFAKQRYPWLRYVRTSDARTLIEDHLRSRPEVLFDDDRVSIRSESRLQFQLRISESDLDVTSEDGLVEVLACHRGAGYSLYTMQKAPGTATLSLRSRESDAGVSRTALSPGVPALQAARRPAQRGEFRRKPRRICLVADRESWAFDNIAKNISRLLSSQFEVEIKYRVAFESEAQLHREIFLGPRRWDHVHFFWHPTLASLLDPEVSLEISSALGDETRTYFINNVARTCKTTSVYCHQFLSEHEGDRVQLASLAFADGYAVASPRLLDEYSARSFLPRPAAVLADGVDLTLFRPFDLDRLLDTDRTLVVGWAGNSAWGADTDHKGLKTIIKPVLARLATEGLDVRGDFCDREIAWRPHESMPGYYGGIDVYVCASLSEGTPNPVLEAMACGLPILSTDVGIVREVFGPRQQEFIVGDRTSPEFESKLRQLVTTPSLRMELGRENQQSIQSCSWEQRAASWVHFFSEVEARKEGDASIPQQVAAQYRALDAGRRIQRTRAASPAATMAPPTRGVRGSLRRRLKAWRSGDLAGRALLQHLLEPIRFLSLSCRSERYVRKWCDERELPSCYPDFDWWRYVDEYRLDEAGIKTPRDGARHWLAFGRNEVRVLRPHALALVLQRLRASLSRAPRKRRGKKPVVSVIASSMSDSPLGEKQLESILFQAGTSLECFRLRPNGAVDYLAPRPPGEDSAPPVVSRLGGIRATEVFHRAVLRTGGDWIVTLGEGQCFSRPDSLETMLEQAEAGTELLVWRHGSSEGSAPFRPPMTWVPASEECIAGFAVRRRFRHLLVSDGHSGAVSRLLRSLTHSLKTQWVDDVLTYRPAGATARAAALPTASDGGDSRHELPVDLVYALWSDRRAREIQKESFFRERVYSFYPVESSSMNEDLPQLLGRQEGKRVLLVGPDVQLAPYFSHRCLREVALRTNGNVALAFVSGQNGQTSPLAIVTDGASLRRITSQDPVRTFAELYERLRTDGRSFDTVDTELFERIDA